MAKSKPVSELTEEELRSQRKTMKAIVAVVAAIAVIYLVVAGFLIANGKSKDQLPLLGVPFFAMSVSSLPAITRIGVLNAEIKRRESSGE